MAGIAGITQSGKQEQVVHMLSKLTHRGNDRAKLFEKHNVVIEATWPEVQARPTPLSLQFNAVWDGMSAPLCDPKSLHQHKEPFACEHFGDLSELAWMGRTKGAPVQ